RHIVTTDQLVQKLLDIGLGAVILQTIFHAILKRTAFQCRSGIAGRGARPAFTGKQKGAELVIGGACFHIRRLCRKHANYGVGSLLQSLTRHRGTPSFYYYLYYTICYA